MSSPSMDRLFAKLGRPPYQLDHVTSLREECRLLASAMEAGHAVERDAALEMFNMMEQMTYLIMFDRPDVFPQILTAEAVQQQTRFGRSDTANTHKEDEEPLHSFASETMQYGQILLAFLKLPESSQEICQQCNWTFERMLRNEKPPHGKHLHEIPGFESRNGLGHFILAQYDEPGQSRNEDKIRRCNLCVFVWDRMSPVRRDLRRDQCFTVWLGPFWQIRDERRLECVNIKAYSPSRGATADSWDLEKDLDVSFIVETSDHALAREFNLMGIPEEDTLTSSNFSFMKKLLLHSESQRSGTVYQPKRLLDLGPDPTAVPHLVEHDQRTASGHSPKYAALSYCWGPKAEAEKQLKLTAHNGDEFKRAIPLETMTVVLQDAVSVCRILDIRYIWIDALCIVQGQTNHSDWEEQSYEMSQIFGNSWLTICAVASSSCLQPFLHHIDRKSHTIQFNLYSHDLTDFDGSLRLRLSTNNGKPTGSGLAKHWPLDLDLRSSEWNERGWVYQEKVLSPRKLFFGARMVHFQDQYHVYSENGCKTPVSFLRRRNDNLIEYRKLLSPQTLQSQHPFIPDVWYRIAVETTNLRLTDRLDVFPALSGVARMFTQVTAHRYVAGLWEEDLHCGLLWFYFAPFRPSQPKPPASLRQLIRALQSPSAVAPSWSWASSEGTDMNFMNANQISTRCRIRTHVRPRYTLQNVETEIDGSNPLGRVKNASVTLCGRVIALPAKCMPATIATVQVLRWICRVDGGASIIFIFADWSPACPTATGLHNTSQARLMLLAIADCCSSRQISPDFCEHCGHAFAESTLLSGGIEPEPEVESCRRCRGLHMIQVQQMVQPADHSSYFEDSMPGFNPSKDCHLCADTRLKRDVWGLLIFPTGDANTYYRVGTFISRAEHGGSSIFHDAEERMVKLI